MTTQSFLFNQADDLKVPGDVPITCLADWANAGPDQINRGNWGLALAGLLKAREALEAAGHKETWLQGYINVARENSQRVSTPAEVEWQIRGRHHYEWRKTTEALAAGMHRVNRLHVRAVTVVTGAVRKGGV